MLEQYCVAQVEGRWCLGVMCVALTRSEGQVALKWVWMRRGITQTWKTGECARKHPRTAAVNMLVPEQARMYFEYLRNS